MVGETGRTTERGGGREKKKSGKVQVGTQRALSQRLKKKWKEKGGNGSVGREEVRRQGSKRKKEQVRER